MLGQKQNSKFCHFRNSTCFEEKLENRMKVTIGITARKFGIVARRIANFDTEVKQLQQSRLVQTAAVKNGVEM